MNFWYICGSKFFKMKNLSILFLAIFSMSLFSCKDNTKETELEVETVDNSADSQKTYEVAKTDAEFNNPKVEAIFEQYLKIENALVNTDAKTASAEASKLEPMLLDIEADDVIRAAASGMASSEDVEVQRENFEHLSNGMEKLLEGSLKSGTLYKQFCPMAFNNRGAYWISSGRDILNPYYGDKMLKCGRVDAEIK